jgi:hypothetical protein
MQAQLTSNQNGVDAASTPASGANVLEAIHQEGSVTAEGGYIVSDIFCRRLNNVVRCTFKVTNYVPVARVTLLAGEELAVTSQAFDEGGVRHDSAGGSLGGRGVTSELPQRVPVGGT